MKLYIKHTNMDHVLTMVDRMINAAAQYAKSEKEDLDTELLSKVVQAVKLGMGNTMEILLKDCSEVTVEFDIEDAIGQTFENVSKAIKWIKDDEASQSISE